MYFNKTNIQNIITAISNERFKPYLERCSNEKEALCLYRYNIEKSQEFYSLLAILEVTLRNKINQSCIDYFKNKNWLLENLPDDLSSNIEVVKTKLEKSKKEITNSKILAELNFGFWTTLFNRKYAKIFWKPLHRIFVNLPKQNKKRQKVSASLNSVRYFRNRIYHYEPIIWNEHFVNKQKNDIFQIIFSLDEDTYKWLKTFE